MLASHPGRRRMVPHFIEQPRYPGSYQDRRLCVPALRLVCLCSDENGFNGFVLQSVLSVPSSAL
jgi:hypothetical protein